MKKTLLTLAIIVGGIIGVILLFFVAQVGYYHTFLKEDGETLDRESKAWVDDIGPKILSSWDVDEIANFASTEYIQSIPRERHVEFSNVMLEQYGTLEKYNSAEGESGVHINNFKKTITAEYVIEADFTKGSTRIFIQGIKEEDGWKIFTIHVDPDPSLMWWNGQLTRLEEGQDYPESVDGVKYRKLLDW